MDLAGAHLPGLEGAWSQIAGVEGYMIGAGFISLGLIPLAIGAWFARQLPPWIPILWIASALVVSHMLIHQERLDRDYSMQNGRAVLVG
jgi:hypothetical protein